jgi:hypothetical protein
MPPPVPPVVPGVVASLDEQAPSKRKKKQQVELLISSMAVNRSVRPTPHRTTE